MDTEHEQNRVLLEDMDTEHEQNRVLLENMDTEHEQNRVYLRIWTLNMNRTVFHLHSVLRVIIYNFALVLYPDRHYTLRSFCF